MRAELENTTADAKFGYMTCLQAVEITLSQIEEELSQQIERNKRLAMVSRRDFEKLAVLAGSSTRLGAQRALLVSLRDGLRPLLVDEDISIISSIWRS